MVGAIFEVWSEYVTFSCSDRYSYALSMLLCSSRWWEKVVSRGPVRCWRVVSWMVTLLALLPASFKIRLVAPPHAKIFHVIEKLREDARLRIRPIQPTHKEIHISNSSLSCYLVVIESIGMKLLVKYSIFRFVVPLVSNATKVLDVGLSEWMNSLRHPVQSLSSRRSTLWIHLRHRF